MNKFKKFDARLDLVPKNPGVYLMKDSSGSVIYVGKAVNLKNRLRNYFTLNPKGNAKTLSMISNIDSYAYFVCNTEIEALLLECNLIKEYNPKYNILLRDDKEYPYIKVTLNKEYPDVIKAFRIASDVKDGAKYYGPYMAGTLKIALKTLKTIFPVKDCKRVFPRDIGKERPCLNYYIGKCIAPCKGDVSSKEYRKSVLDICRFLEGKYDEVIVDLKEKMRAASDLLDFETAGAYKEKIEALQEVISKQTITDHKRKDMDVIGFSTNNTQVCVQKLIVREGRLIGNFPMFATDSDEPGIIIESLLMQHYILTKNIPTTILMPFEFTQISIMESALTQLANRSVSIVVPQRGDKKNLIKLANKNSLQALRRHAMLSGGGEKIKEEANKLLSKILFNDENKIKRIEAFDVSNYGVDDKSAAMTVFVDGKPQKNEYRLYKLEATQTQDDYSGTRQVIMRRGLRLQKENNSFPDLILVDGGIGHVNTAVDALNRIGIHQIMVCGMRKDNKHRTKAIVLPDNRVIELKEEDDNFLTDLAQRRALLKYITIIQDETHRFAISYTKKLSKKRNLKFSLESIDGVGPAKRKALLKHFGSIRGIKNASIKELEAVEKIDKNTAIKVYEHLNEGEK